MMEDHPTQPPLLEASKTQRKREAHRAQVVGERLVALTPVQLERLPLPNDLRQAVLAARAERSRSARKRHLQFIGKLMRRHDWRAIEAAVERALCPERHDKAQLQRCEHWRERLLSGGKQALSEFLDHYPHADRQQLRQLVRNACREREQARPPRMARMLFRFINTQIKQSAE